MMGKIGMGMILAAALVACSDTAGRAASTTGPGGPGTPDGGATADGGADPFDTGTELRLAVPETGRVFVKLGGAAPVSVSGDPRSSRDWDLAFEGYDVFTNGGISGGGQGASFGPLEPVVFLGDTVPTVPFTLPDKAGGAFIDWYAYEGSTHALWSRYHVLGVKDGTRLWKVQVLTYYGERDGATVAGLFKIRYAELGAAGPGATQEVVVDGTAGGTAAPASTPSECLDLGTGARTMHTAEEAQQTSDWHLCFRRSSITVNGETGGPRNVGAVDLEAAAVANETVETVMQRTADSQKAAFDAAVAGSFDGRLFRGDRVVSGFGTAWLDSTATPLAPAAAAWLVVDAAGTTFLLGFNAFQNPTARSPGTVVMRIKPVEK